MCWIAKDAIGLRLIQLEQLLDAEDDGEIASSGEDERKDANRPFDEGIEDDSVEIDEDLSASAIVLIAPGEDLVVSSSLLDSEIGGPGLLKISCCEVNGTASDGLKTPPVTAKPLIQEM